MKFGFVTVGSSNYYSIEHKVHQIGLQAIQKILPKDIILVDIVDEIREENDFIKVKRKMSEVDMLVIQCGGFADGNLIPLFDSLNKPMCIWAINEPTHNGDIQLHSLVTQNLFMSILKNKLKSKNIVYYLNGKNNLTDCKDDFLSIIKAIKTILYLKNKTICQIGTEAEGFLNLKVDQKKIKDIFGITIVKKTISELVEMAKQFSNEEVKEIMKIIINFNIQNMVSDESLEKTIRIYLALREITLQNKYIGLAISCWPELQEQFGMVPCFSFSLLSEIDDIVVSCEGDILGLISMLVLKEMSNEKPTLLDLTEFSFEKDAILFWHCGYSPLSYCDKKIKIINHPMLNRRSGDKMGVSQDFIIEANEVTIFRISGDNFKVFSVLGKATKKVFSGFTGTRLWVNNFKSYHNKISSKELIGKIMDNGIEHHYAICRTNEIKGLELFAKILGLELV